LVAGLLLAVIPAVGQRITRHFPVDPAKVKAKEMADALAPQVEQVKKDFDTKRQSLHTVPGPDGKPAFLRKDVANVITQTGKELDQAIIKVQPSDLAPLQAWSAEELAQIQAKLGALPGPKTAAFSSRPFTPYAVAVFASLNSPPKHAKPKQKTPKAAAPKPVAPPPDTVPAEKSNSILDEVGEVVSRIFTLASTNNLEVKLWVGSTAPHTMFSFWSQGQTTEATPAPKIIRTDGKLDHVIRGFYLYRAAWTKGAVTQSIQYPNPDGTPAAQTPSERLDLVKGSRYFCCRFDQSYCHHVDNEKDCRL